MEKEDAGRLALKFVNAAGSDDSINYSPIHFAFFPKGYCGVETLKVGEWEVALHMPDSEMDPGYCVVKVRDSDGYCEFVPTM